MDAFNLSMAEQAKETLAAGEPPDVADRREAALLGDLPASLPELKSNAEKFTKSNRAE